MAVVGGGEEERAGTRDEEEDWTGGEEAVGDTAGEGVAGMKRVPGMET